MQFHGRYPRAAACLALVVLASTCRLEAAEPFQFAPARHGQGTLTRVGKVPLLVVCGTPEEMGEQLGALLAQPLGQLAGQQTALLRGFGLAGPPALLLTVGKLVSGHMPENYLAELRAISKSSGVSYDFLLFGNMIYDYSKIGGCSVLMVEPERSATGQVLFGRNMDFPTFGFLDRCGLLVIYVPRDKHAFASVTFPGFVGCISGMNDAGLAVAQLEVNHAKDGSPRFTPAGTPLALCFRRLLEECANVDEAEKLLDSMPRTSMCNLAIADRKQTAVFEITTRSVVRRPAEGGFCACTNHFRSRQLAENTQCDRYRSLAEVFDQPKLDLADVHDKLDDVNQGQLTIHTMIFEPAALRLHLALGKGPVSAAPLEAIELAPWFKGERPAQ